MKAARNNRVRIIGGRLRSRLLSFPDAPGLRPTPDRARETLFNWLGQDLAGLTCLDAFAGSGALGFEAVSRGAAKVVMLEQDARALAALRQNAATLPAPEARIEAGDALAYLAQPGCAFDLIFLDPPFALDLMPRVLSRAATRLAPGGKIYAESPRTLAADGYTILRQGRAGHSHFCLLEPA